MGNLRLIPNLRRHDSFMRKTLWLLLLATSALALPSSAQMFATIKECNALFGEPLPKTGETSDVRFYNHDGATIKILFVEEKAAVMTYTPLVNTKLGSEAQTKLLNANAGGQQWEEIEGEGSKTWQRSDGLAFAIYDPTNEELNIFSTDYIEKSKDEVQGAINQQ